ncbi:EPIDERMAL PATTERNING FACTOR-like protein 9 [Cynara cardunculus var. scolymus]|uniref:EPIDERMAL PATTERNING FACTOR-like protein 9 n=1 Tax=Cynara cardunculus var. scolymus TaxID=59895 RepID=UPI000D62C033|nr:EPIDERMAL PATTERNING FACTOR-like protein 9 [Cynara cardunculus var. scolymus]
MAYPNLLFYFIWATIVLQGVSGDFSMSRRQLQERSNVWIGKNSSRQSVIGSVMPTCTYNECRGCKYRCKAEQVPVEGNDPINSAYHYRCICHR